MKTKHLIFAIILLFSMQVFAQEKKNTVYLTPKENPCTRVLDIFISDSMVDRRVGGSVIPPTKDSLVSIWERSGGKIYITDVWKEYFSEDTYKFIQEKSMFCQYKHLGVIYVNEGGAGIFSPEKCGCAQKPFPHYKLPERVRYDNYEPKAWSFVYVEGKLFLNQMTSEDYPDLNKYFEVLPGQVNSGRYKTQ